MVSRVFHHPFCTLQTKGGLGGELKAQTPALLPFHPTTAPSALVWTEYRVGFGSQTFARWTFISACPQPNRSFTAGQLFNELLLLALDVQRLTFFLPEASTVPGPAPWHQCCGRGAVWDRGLGCAFIYFHSLFMPQNNALCFKGTIIPPLLTSYATPGASGKAREEFSLINRNK